ncbi:Hypothetical predicted protein [Mytilus galloprovincialis]|uniref:Apextrin C-terminal domain-containing protein n=1 Tax=Mytilus galloprovincialis TaxID=29158 RepID=A0A8B6CCA8_MYTGA|nr:Hypothetical predicted protein [Mytilus galloprovincialis]
MMSTWTLFFLFQSVMAVSWPSGTYTLIKPKSGCPSNWKIGWRHQDNEDNNNQNSVSSPHHFAGTQRCITVLKTHTVGRDHGQKGITVSSNMAPTVPLKDIESDLHKDGLYLPVSGNPEYNVVCKCKDNDKSMLYDHPYPTIDTTKYFPLYLKL